MVDNARLRQLLRVRIVAYCTGGKKTNFAVTLHPIGMSKSSLLTSFKSFCEIWTSMLRLKPAVIGTLGT